MQLTCQRLEHLLGASSERLTPIWETIQRNPNTNVWRVFASDHDVLHSAHDAARFGFPQEETMLYCFSNGSVGQYGFNMTKLGAGALY